MKNKYMDEEDKKNVTKMCFIVGLCIGVVFYAVGLSIWVSLLVSCIFGWNSTKIYRAVFPTHE